MMQFCGWAGETEAKRAWDQIGGLFPKFLIAGAGPREAGRVMRLWEVVRKALGQDTKNYPQGTGDCVAFGAKNAVEYVQGVEIFKGDREQFHPVFPSYFYGTSRMLVGGGRMGRQAGSVGSWMAKAVTDYGTLRSDFGGVPAYSGAVSDKWGTDKAAFERFLGEGKAHPIRTTARVTSWDQLVDSVVNGYPCTIASNQGFEMQAGSDGFHDPSGSWPHQMCVVAVNDDPRRPWGGILNSWGDRHGKVVDLDTGEPWPVGTLRVRRDTIERMLRSGECFAYSQFDGFPSQDFDWADLGGRERH